MDAIEFFQAKLDFEMTPWTLKAHQDAGTIADYLVLDARGPEDYAAGHIPGARSVPLAKAVDADLPKGKTLVTCGASMTCALGPKLALALAKRGFKVMTLVGGFGEWAGKGFPVER